MPWPPARRSCRSPRPTPWTRSRPRTTTWSTTGSRASWWSRRADEPAGGGGVPHTTADAPLREQLAKLADGDDRALRVVRAGDHVEPGAAGLDVGAQELCDLLGRAIGRVALEWLEGHLVEVLHLCGERLAWLLTCRGKAAPDVESVLGRARVSAGLAGR